MVFDSVSTGIKVSTALETTCRPKQEMKPRWKIRNQIIYVGWCCDIAVPRFENIFHFHTPRMCFDLIRLG